MTPLKYSEFHFDERENCRTHSHLVSLGVNVALRCRLIPLLSFDYLS